MIILDGRKVFDGTLDQIRRDAEQLCALPGLSPIFPDDMPTGTA